MTTPIVYILILIFTVFGLYESNKILNKGDYYDSLSCIALTFMADFLLLLPSY